MSLSSLSLSPLQLINETYFLFSVHHKSDKEFYLRRFFFLPPMCLPVCLKVLSNEKRGAIKAAALQDGSVANKF
jgi:hypothetical protein